MASLILGAGILVHDKIKSSKAKKQEKKRKAYEARYNELEQEHKTQEATFLERKMTGDSNSRAKDAATAEKQPELKRHSSDSQRSIHSHHDEDSPARWVEEAQRERQRDRQRTA
jgi:hypothetical protein